MGELFREWLCSRSRRFLPTSAEKKIDERWSADFVPIRVPRDLLNVKAFKKFSSIFEIPLCSVKLGVTYLTFQSPAPYSRILLFSPAFPPIDLQINCCPGSGARGLSALPEYSQHSLVHLFPHSRLLEISHVSCQKARYTPLFFFPPSCPVLSHANSWYENRNDWEVVLNYSAYERTGGNIYIGHIFQVWAPCQVELRFASAEVKLRELDGQVFAPKQ